MTARVRASFGRQAMMATLGVRLSAVRQGRVELVVDHDDRFTQQHGFLHAGAVAAVLDSACGYAAFTVMPPDAAVLRERRRGVVCRRLAAADHQRPPGPDDLAGHHEPPPGRGRQEVDRVGRREA